MSRSRNLIHILTLSLFIVGILLVPAGRALAYDWLTTPDNAGAWLIGENDANWAFGGARWVPTATESASQITFQMFTGGCSVDVYLTVYSESSPGNIGSLLATSDSLDASTFGAAPGTDQTFTFSPSFTFNAGTPYLLILRTSPNETCNGGNSIGYSLTDSPYYDPTVNASINSQTSGYPNTYRTTSSMWSTRFKTNGTIVVGATQITSVIPPDDPTNSNARATSTTFAIEGEGIVNPADFLNGATFRINIKNNAGVPTNSLVGPGYSSGGVAICNWLFDWLCPPTVDDDTQITGAQTAIINRTWEWEIEDSGAFDFATTTDLQQIGRYTMTASIFVPAFDVFGITGGTRTLVSTTTSFFVATSTWYDVSHDAAVALTDKLSSEATSANCEVNFSTVFGLLDLGDCLIYLFGGSAQYVADALSVQIADLTSRVPWGYATRVYIILSSDVATSSLPSIAATVPEGLPNAGTTFDFSPWEPTNAAILDLETIELPGGTGSVMDNFMGYWNTMWLIVFAFWLMRELHDTFGGVDFEHNPESDFRGRTKHGYQKYKVVGKSRVRATRSMTTGPGKGSLRPK